MKKLIMNQDLTRFIARAGLKFEKYSPEILVGIGIIGFVTTVVLASKATKKLDHITKNHAEEMDNIIEEYEVTSENIKLSDRKEMERTFARKVGRRYLLTTKELLVLYGPSLAVGAGAIGCFLGSYKVLSNRNAGLAAAYSVLQTTFNEYRKRTIAENGAKGEQADKEKMTAIVKAKKNNKSKDNFGDFDSPYAVFFDEYSVYWKRDSAYNLQFLQSQQNYANDMLRANGHLFLNEVYKMLGLPHTSAGAVTGWVYSSREDQQIGDNFVDFGIHLPRNNSFVNGEEPSILLDFNVDGVIYDLI